MTETVTLGTAAAIIVASWVIAVRIFYRMSRDLSAISQRVAYLEGRLDTRASSDTSED